MCTCGTLAPVAAAIKGDIGDPGARKPCFFAHGKLPGPGLPGKRQTQNLKLETFTIMETSWFIFNGDKQPFVPANYIKTNKVPEFSNGNQLYAIEAAVLPGNHPDFDTPGLKDNMLRALMTKREQTNPGVKLKKREG